MGSPLLLRGRPRHGFLLSDPPPAMGLLILAKRCVSVFWMPFDLGQRAGLVCAAALSLLFLLSQFVMGHDDPWVSVGTLLYSDVMMKCHVHHAPTQAFVTDPVACPKPKLRGLSCQGIIPIILYVTLWQWLDFCSGFLFSLFSFFLFKVLRVSVSGFRVFCLGWKKRQAWDIWRQVWDMVKFEKSSTPRARHRRVWVAYKQGLHGQSWQWKEAAGEVRRFRGRQSFTPKVVPGTALPWHRLGSVGGFEWVNVDRPLKWCFCWNCRSTKWR